MTWPAFDASGEKLRTHNFIIWNGGKPSGEIRTKIDEAFSCQCKFDLPWDLSWKLQTGLGLMAGLRYQSRRVRPESTRTNLEQNPLNAPFLLESQRPVTRWHWQSFLFDRFLNQVKCIFQYPPSTFLLRRKVFMAIWFKLLPHLCCLLCYLRIKKCNTINNCSDENINSRFFDQVNRQDRIQLVYGILVCNFWKRRRGKGNHSIHINSKATEWLNPSPFVVGRFGSLIIPQMS